MRNFLSRLLILIIALQILNLGVQAQDFPPPFVYGSTGTHNVTETVSEYIIEVVLGHKGVIKENFLHHKTPVIHKHFSFKAINYQPQFPIPVTELPGSILAKTKLPAYDFLFFQEINPPPPKC